MYKETNVLMRKIYEARTAHWDIFFSANAIENIPDSYKCWLHQIGTNSQWAIETFFEEYVKAYLWICVVL